MLILNIFTIFILVFFVLLMTWILIVAIKAFRKYNNLEKYVVEHTDEFISTIDRAEASEDPRVWCKAVRSVLIAFAFDKNWVNEEFRDRIEKFYGK